MALRADVYIRPVKTADEDEFLALMNVSRELHHPWINPPTSPALFHYYMKRLARDDHNGFAICDRKGDHIVGVININNIVRGSFLSASLGYYVGAPYLGHGYMQQGLTLLVHHAFAKMGLHRLEANIQPDNTRSINLVQRCGFTKEGVSPAFLYIDGAWRDHERWCAVHDRRQLHR